MNKKYFNVDNNNEGEVVEINKNEVEETTKESFFKRHKKGIFWGALGTLATTVIIAIVASVCGGDDDDDTGEDFFDVDPTTNDDLGGTEG